MVQWLLLRSKTRSLSHRPQVDKTWFLCDNSSIVKPRNPKKLSVKCWPLANNENTIAVEPRFTVQVQPTDLNCLLGCWFLSFNIFFSYLSFLFRFFFSRIKLLKSAMLWIAFKGNSSNVFIYIFLRNVDVIWLHCRWGVIESSWRVDCWSDSFVDERLTFNSNPLPVVEPMTIFSILAPRSSVVPFGEWRQNWVIIFAYS